MTKARNSFIYRFMGTTIAAISLALSRPALASADLGNYAGTYVLVQQTVTVTEIPILADVVATTRAVSLQHLDQSADRLYGSGTLCGLWIESSSSLVETTIPEAFRRALPPILTEARLIPDAAGLRFVQATQTNVVGARLRNPQTDPLPKDARDPRIVDSDRDGKPGMTVRVNGIVSGEIYVAQRGTSRLSGRLRRGIFTGTIAFSNEQRILGATSRYLEDPLVVKPDYSRSKFWLVPVKPSANCDEALLVARQWR